MEFLLQFLPIIIYILLIVIIVVGIILGIKIIITIDKVTRIVDNVNEKFERISPLLDAVGYISDKFGEVINTVFGAAESLITKLFIRNNKENEESDEDE